jgi:hypothetical protein
LILRVNTAQFWQYGLLVKRDLQGEAFALATDCSVSGERGIGRYDFNLIHTQDFVRGTRPFCEVFGFHEQSAFTIRQAGMKARREFARHVLMVSVYEQTDLHPETNH